jgi:hypothetical protein
LPNAIDLEGVPALFGMNLSDNNEIEMLKIGHYVVTAFAMGI